MLYIDKIPEKEQYYVRGEHAVIQKDVQRGISIFKELGSLYPEEKEAIYIVGDYSFHLQDYPTAIAYLERVLAMDPTFERAYQHLCWTYSVTRDYDRKMQVARQYVGRVPAVESYLLFADAYISQEKFDSAVQVLTRSLDAFPNSSRIVEALAATHMFRNDLENAEAECRRLIQPSRTTADQRSGYWGLVNVNIHRGKYREAVRIIDKVREISLNENERAMIGEAHTWKAFYLKELLGDVNNARSELQKATEYREAGNQGYYIGLYNALIALDEFAQAREIGKTKLLTIFPKYDFHVSAHQSMSTGNYVAAITSFKSLEPVISQSELLRLAECYLANGQANEASEVLQRLRGTYSTLFDAPAERARTLAKSYLLSGKVYEKNGDTNHALENYHKVLDLWKEADKDIPDYIEAKTRFAKLKGMVG
jgi:tetratricopeptide (TPR) repeat protein